MNVCAKLVYGWRMLTLSGRTRHKPQIPHKLYPHHTEGRARVSLWSRSANPTFGPLAYPCTNSKGCWKWFTSNVASGPVAGASSLLFDSSLDYARVRPANDATSAKGGGWGASSTVSSVVGVYRRTDGIAELYGASPSQSFVSLFTVVSTSVSTACSVSVHMQLPSTIYLLF